MNSKLGRAICAWWPGNNRNISTGISSGAVYIAVKQKTVPATGMYRNETFPAMQAEPGGGMRLHLWLGAFFTHVDVWGLAGCRIPFIIGLLLSITTSTLKNTFITF